MKHKLATSSFANAIKQLLAFNSELTTLAHVPLMDNYSFPITGNPKHSVSFNYWE